MSSASREPTALSLCWSPGFRPGGGEQCSQRRTCRIYEASTDETIGGRRGWKGGGLEGQERLERNLRPFELPVFPAFPACPAFPASSAYPGPSPSPPRRRGP